MTTKSLRDTCELVERRVEEFEVLVLVGKRASAIYRYHKHVAKVQEPSHSFMLGGLIAEARRINQRRMFKEARGGSMNHLDAVNGRVSGLPDQFRVIPMGDQRYSGIRGCKPTSRLYPGFSSFAMPSRAFIRLDFPELKWPRNPTKAILSDC